MLFRESYEFTCLIIAIFGKDCQVFFPYLAIIFLFFSATKNSGTQCPEKEMTVFTPFPICSDNRIIWFFTEAWEGSSLGARLRTRKVRGRDASLPAPLLSAFKMMVARRTVGALPQTPQGTLSLDPARGNCPLTPFRDWVGRTFMLLPRAAFVASPKPLFAPPTFRENLLFSTSSPRQSGTNSPALRDMHLLTRKTPSVSTPRHRGK